MKNNFDYIFCVIRSLSFDHPENIVKNFFEFYIIDENKYKREIELILRNYSGETCKSFFSLQNKPSLGIFGNQFMFVDSLDQSSHGTMYTQSYNPDGNSRSLLTASIEIFEKILSCATRVEFFDLLKQYNRIIAREKAWENHLKTIWNNNKSKGEV